MNSYLSGDQVHVLVNAYRAGGYRAGTKLISRPGLKVDIVEGLYLEGYLSKNGRQYKSNRKTETALVDHDFILDELDVEKAVRKKPAVDKRESKIDSLRQHVNAHNELSTDVLSSRSNLQGLLLQIAINKARAGDPWDFIRRQWPELVITDELDLAYFKKYCERDHNLDLRLDDIQVKLIEHGLDPSLKEIAIKGSTSPGKGFATALLLNIFYSIYTNDRIVIVSQSSKHAKDVMFAEMVTWRKKMRYSDGCDILTAEIKDPNNPRHVVIIANPDTGEGLSGRHGEHTTFCFDETSSCPDDLPINARKQAAMIIYVSNPRILSGFFFDLFPKDNPDDNQVIVDKGIKRALLTFGGNGALNVRAKRLRAPFGPPGGMDVDLIDGTTAFIAAGDKVPEDLIPHTRPLIPGQMDYDKYATIMLSPNETERAWSGEGKFPPEDADFQIIPPSWLKDPCALWTVHHEKIEVTGFGLDLAASKDKDETVLAAGGILGIKKLFRTRKANSMQTLAWVHGCAMSLGIDLKRGEVPVAIDAIGAGGNVMADIMEQAGCIMLRMVGNATATNASLYRNVRAELYGEFGSRLNPEIDNMDPYLLPDDSKLREELSAHERLYSADMTRFYVTPKDRTRGEFRDVQPIKERIGRSPDSSDAVVLCYWVVRDTEFDSSVVNQFVPGEVLDRVGSKDSKIVVTTGDGEEEEMSEDDFMSSWGSKETSIEQEMALFRAALSGVRNAPGGSMFL